MWELKYAPRIKKDLKGIPHKNRTQIKTSIEKLQQDPFAVSKQLRKHPIANYSLRVGVYRVLFDIDVSAKAIHILKIGHRRDIYR